MGKIIDGKAIAAGIRQELKEAVDRIQGRKPCLAVLLVGEHGPSQIYVRKKVKACGEVGITSIRRDLPLMISEKELLQEIDAFNRDPDVDGILVQLPLPNHIHERKVTEAIDPKKDVDGFHPMNVGKMLIGDEDFFLPCTPLGIKVLLDQTGISASGKHVVIVGRSNIVGKPMSALLLRNAPGCNATVTVVHRYTPDISPFCRNADILIVAIGKPKFITADMVKEGAVVIDVGINQVNDSDSPIGDVDFENVKDKCSFITPVPGGVGPMTIAMLLRNTIFSFHKRNV